jgi:myo-inositol 2-dehydrogenase / D-chiro-inositol 1-dehydrogenase
MQRRTFLRNAATVSTFAILKPDIVFKSLVNSAIRVGIIGCGNRGTAVITSMSQNTNTHIIAMADLFEDKLQKGVSVYNQLNSAKNLPAISSSYLYKGSKAYLKLIENKDVDAVLISTPAYAHPFILEAAVTGGKHVYCEKPVAPDTEGCKRALAIGEKLSSKLSVVIGFQIRYASAYAEMVRRVQQGDIGELVNAQLFYISSGTDVPEPRNMSDDEFRIRNHFHFEELSGGILLDQGIHMLDVCNWTLKQHATNAIGTGGMKGAPKLGNTWNNYQVAYQYPNNINVSIHSTQLGPVFGDVCCRFIGTEGIAEAHYSGGVFINGTKAWDSGIPKTESEISPEKRAAGVFLSSLHDADANKEKAFITSIESGNHLNHIEAGVESTLTAILGRNAARTGKKTSWDEIIQANEKIDPKLNLGQFDKS